LLRFTDAIVNKKLYRYGRGGGGALMVSANPHEKKRNQNGCEGKRPLKAKQRE